jgi:hypothetical protein
MKHSVYCGLMTCLLMIAMQIQADEPVASALGADLTDVAVVSDDELDVYRGEGIDVTTLNIAELDGTLHDNTAINSVNGGNTISNGAFASANGLTTAIQNSGNNVLIQNSTIVNVVIEQAPVR